MWFAALAWWIKSLPSIPVQAWLPGLLPLLSVTGSGDMMKVQGQRLTLSMIVPHGIQRVTDMEKNLRRMYKIKNI